MLFPFPTKNFFEGKKQKSRYFHSWKEREISVIFRRETKMEKNRNCVIFRREEKYYPPTGGKQVFFPSGQVGVSSRATAYARRLLPLTS